MFLALISSRFLSFQLYCKCNCSSASLWTVLPVVYDVMWFHLGKSSEFRSSSYDCLSIYIVAAIAFFLRCCQVFLRPLIVPLLLGGS